MEQQEFKTGDVVERDGVKMCVRSIEGNRATCNWFDGAGELHEEEFELDELAYLDTEVSSS